MAFGELAIAKQVALAAPKYRRLVEPFGDYGTLALYPGKKKPKEHIVNCADETVFAIMSLLQSMTAGDKKRLKQYDWAASPETFDAAVSISATEGLELFYRYFYLKKFAAKAKDPEAPPAFDYLKLGHDMRAMLYTLPVARVGLKGVSLTNDDPISLLGNGGPDTYMILLPKTPEHIAAVEGRLGGLGARFFYAKKSMSNDDLFESVAANSGAMIVSTFAASSIMMAQMEVRTNYASRLTPLQTPEEMTQTAR
tara:strand:- start:19782 stop:20540 length:759 start_codon:yes stop_codon:yes gene_type:complete